MKNKRYNQLNTAEWISILTTLLSADWLQYEHNIPWPSEQVSITVKSVCLHYRLYAILKCLH